MDKNSVNNSNQNPVVTITMGNGSVIRAELYPETAPNTVNNFISLINKGFYDGLIFHRVIRGFMIQGGCPDGSGMGGPGYEIKGEFDRNGVKNPLKHTEGVLSMARAQDPDSAGSQFFIMHKNAPHLDGSYAAFGKVIEGMDVVDMIAETPTDYSDRPLDAQRMETVTVEPLGRSILNRSAADLPHRMCRPCGAKAAHEKSAKNIPESHVKSKASETKTELDIEIDCQV